MIQLEEVEDLCSGEDFGVFCCANLVVIPTFYAMFCFFSWVRMATLLCSYSFLLLLDIILHSRMMVFMKRLKPW